MCLISHDTSDCPRLFLSLDMPSDFPEKKGKKALPLCPQTSISISFSDCQKTKEKTKKNKTIPPTKMSFFHTPALPGGELISIWNRRAKVQFDSFTRPQMALYRIIFYGTSSSPLLSAILGCCGWSTSVRWTLRARGLECHASRTDLYFIVLRLSVSHFLSNLWKICIKIRKIFKYLNAKSIISFQEFYKKQLIVRKIKDWISD